MNHFEQLKNSRYVLANVPDLKIENSSGKYWNSIGSCIVGAHDIRPRMGEFTNPWSARHDTDYDMPKLIAVEDKLATLLDRRATELLEISRNEQRKLCVLWSGGIDSTCVLSSLIKNTNNLEQLVVYLSAESVIENTRFYQDHISGKIQVKHIRTLNITEEFFKENILLHGDPGDSIYGPSLGMFRSLIPSKQHLSPWRDNLGLVIDGVNQRTLQTGFSEWYVKKIANNIDSVKEYEITTIADFWWWHYFNLKWDFSLLRPFFASHRKDGRTSFSDTTVKKYAKTAFYSADYFQNWSYTNLHRLTHSVEGHKIDARNYIYDLNPDDYYFNNKSQSPSTSLSPNKLELCYLDSDYQGHYYNDPGVKEAMKELLENFRE